MNAGAGISKKQLMSVYRHMLSRFGFLDWWPGDTKEEILVGAVLTQQTTWLNVEKAIANLKKEHMLSIKAISSANIELLEKLIMPSGYYRQKALRLKEICSLILHNYGSLESLFSMPLPELRKTLLEMKGIGPETADSIVLYAAEKPTFVIDAYTKRAMSRLFGIDPNMSYYDLKNIFESSIKPDVKLYNDFHAQFVELAKNYCRTKPLCNGCPLSTICLYKNGHQNDTY